jgi:hypothetical protein
LLLVLLLPPLVLLLLPPLGLLLLLQVAACQGSEGDATPFTEVKVDDISEELHKRGYQRYGWEVGGVGWGQAAGRFS